MKRLSLLLLLIYGAGAFAQSTVVGSSGVQDAQGTIWVGGHYEISFVPDPKIPPANYTWSGGNLQNNLFFTGPLIGSSATFSVSIPSNTAILPVGSQWLVKVCPNAASSCQGRNYTVQGATQDVTATLNSVLGNISIVSQQLPWAYNAGEMVVPPNPGALFWNVTTAVINCWSGSSWITTCGAGGGGGGGGTILGGTTALQGVGTTNANNTLAPLPEVQFTYSAPNAAFACQEDHNANQWDVRCTRSGVSWASNPSQALINTIQAAMCYTLTNPSVARVPTVNVPEGNYSVGGNISLPVQLDLEGARGTQYGSHTNLVTTDNTQPMFTQQGSMTFTCNGTNYTVNSGTATFGNITLYGGGGSPGNPNDIGLVANTASPANTYTHNAGFINFGGPGRTVGASATGQNNRGDHIFASSDLQWYYFSGAYNPTGFTDPNYHASLEFSDLDSNWDNIEVYGQLQKGDFGYYNRRNLCDVIIANGRLNDSFIQIAPNLICSFASGASTPIITHNRLDDAWWNSIVLSGAAIVTDNAIEGYCTSPTLNPVNFPSNPGGVTTDANCSAFGINQSGLGSTIRSNYIEEHNGVWPSWPVWGIYLPGNSTAQTPTTVDQPISTMQFETIGGSLGSISYTGNPGADVGRSMYDETIGVNNSVGGTLHFGYNKHAQLQDGSPTTYSNFDGIYPDIYVTINVGANDTIQNNSNFHTCTGANITNAGFSWWWYVPGFGLYQQSCGAAGTIGGTGTVNTYAIFTGISTIGSGHITELGGQVQISLPVAVNDGSGVGGMVQLLEGTVPTALATYDFIYADSATHWLLMNPNATSWMKVAGVKVAGVPGNCAQFGTTGFDFVDAGAACGTGSSPGYFSATTSGVATASTMQMSLVSGVGRLQSYAANNAAAANLTLAGSSADGTTFVSFYWQMHGGTDVTTNLPLIVNASIQPNATTSGSLACSTSGSATFVMPYAGTSFKKVNIVEVACVGTVSWTYTHSFTTTPYAIGPKAADATTIGLNSVTVTGSGTGQHSLESIN